jgi:hypothetical protein
MGRELSTSDRRAVHGVWVACIALIALVAVVGIAVLALPADQKGQNIMAITTASLGVIAGVVGAYFGVSSANRAAELVSSMKGDDGKDDDEGFIQSRR